MKEYIPFLLTLTIIMLLVSCKLNGQDDDPEDFIRAETLNQTEIQNLADTLVDGDILLLPAGNATWTETVIFNGNIAIRGAGKDQTIITKTGGDYAIRINPDGGAVGISDLTIDGNFESFHIQIRGDMRDFVIYNNIFKNSGGRSIEMTGDIFGVIAQNDFIDNAVSDIVVYGDESRWDLPINFGSEEFVFVEDNIFRYTGTGLDPEHSISSNASAKYVFRYNDVEAYFADGFHYAAPVDAHGNYSYGRGTIAYEIYGNTIQSDHSFRGIFLRGGAGRVFNNELTGDFNNPIHLSNYRSAYTPSGETSGGCGDGTYDPSVCTYPAPDQINNLYIWNNLYNGNPITPVVDDRGLMREHVQPGRDYFTSAASGYTPYPHPHPLIQSLIDNAEVQDR